MMIDDREDSLSAHAEHTRKLVGGIVIIWWGWVWPLCACEPAYDVAILQLEQWDGRAYLVSSLMEVNIFEAIAWSSVSIDSHNAFVSDQIENKLLSFGSFQWWWSSKKVLQRLKLNWLFDFLDRGDLRSRILDFLRFLNQSLSELLLKRDLMWKFFLVFFNMAVL